MDSAIKFLQSIKPGDGVVIIFHSDVDGICSCAMLRRWLGTIGIEPYIITQPMPPEPNLLRRIQTSLPKKIIVLDIAIDQNIQLSKKLKSMADVLVVDHHVVTQNLNTLGIIHHNPRLKNPKVYQSCSYLVYKMLNKISDSSDMLWMAVLGAVADYDLSWSEDIIKEAEKKYDVSMFGKIAAMMESVRVTKFMQVDKIVDVIVKSKNIEQILNLGDFKKAYDTIEAEIEAVMQSAKASAECIGDTIFYSIKPKYNIKSPLSTKLSEETPDKFVVVYEMGSRKVDVSFRSQTKKYNCNFIAKQAARGIKGVSAGGHEAAGGATVPLSAWNEFKQKLIEVVQKNY